MNKTLYLIILLSSIVFYPVNVICQSKTDTQEYIIMTINSCGLSKRFFNEKDYFDVYKSISFYKDYFIVNTFSESVNIQDGKYNKTNNINVIPIIDIKEIEIERSEDLDKKLQNTLTSPKEEKPTYLKDGYIFINRHSVKKPYYFENIEEEDLKKIIDSDKLSIYNHGHTTDRISIRFWDVENDEKLNKIKKSISHLVELCGGKILNDLF